MATTTLSYQKPADLTMANMTAAKDTFIQNLAAQAKPNQEIFARPANQTPEEKKVQGDRFDFSVEDSKLKIFGRAQQEKERLGAKLLVENAAPEYFKFKKDELAKEAVNSGSYKPSKEVLEIENEIEQFKQDYPGEKARLDGIYENARAKLGTGTTQEQNDSFTKKWQEAGGDVRKLDNDLAKLEQRKASQIANQVWAPVKIKGSDIHVAAKVNLLVQEGVLNRDTAINADIEQNLDEMIQQMPTLKKAQAAGVITPESLAQDVQGSLLKASQPQNKLEAQEHKQSTRERLQAERKNKVEGMDLGKPKQAVAKAKIG